MNERVEKAFNEKLKLDKNILFLEKTLERLKAKSIGLLYDIENEILFDDVEDDKDEWKNVVSKILYYMW